MPDPNPRDDRVNAPEIYATVPVSVPVVVPELEDVFMNGFVWSNALGLLIGLGNQGEPALDELQDLRRPEESLYKTTQDQGIRGLDA